MVNLSFGIGAMGANLPSALGSASQTLRVAARILHSEPDISISALSRFWRTPAHPAGSGPDFCNAAFSFGTTLPADEVLARFHAIEAQIGRDRSTGRWSARVLDLDLIALEDRIAPDRDTLIRWIDLPPDRQTRESPDRLILPHPRLQDRGFVLAPLAEIAPNWSHPLTGRSVAEMLRGLGADGLAGMTPFSPAQP